MRRLALPLIAVVLVAAVLGVQVAAGGGHYVPRRPANPCIPRPVPPIPAQLEPLAEQIVLIGLDNAACQLGISRERLVLALADTRTLDPRAPAALKAGLRNAVNRLDREGRLPKVSALLPDALGQANLPGIAKTLLEAIPAGLVDNALPTGPLLLRTVDELNVDRLLHQLNDPGQLDSAVRSAILQAALHQIRDRLSP
ncbi:MAG TPA: hypothetical protein VNV17_15470 [Solirubrobacteraceae bacterium]|nr:hypothetical protein [Solirubrobacteraceae bacterium]